MGCFTIFKLKEFFMYFDFLIRYHIYNLQISCPTQWVGILVFFPSFGLFCFFLYETIICQEVTWGRKNCFWLMVLIDTVAQ